MNRVVQLVLGVLSSTLVLSGCGTSGPQSQVAEPVASTPWATVYLPPEVPLESVVIQGTGALARLPGSREFTEVAARVARHYGGRYLRDGRSETGTSFWIVLTVSPDRWTLDQLATLPLDVEVKYGAPATRPQLRRVQAAIVSSMLDRGDEFTGVEAAPSRFATRIVVRYGTASSSKAGPAAHAASLNAALAAGAAVSRGGSLSVPVDFAHDPQLDHPTR